MKSGGRVKGTPNKLTSEFKEAVNKLLWTASPKMVGWIDRIAVDDPARALDLISKLAEYAYPKLSRSDVNATHSGALTIEIVRFNEDTPSG